MSATACQDADSCEGGGARLSYRPNLVANTLFLTIFAICLVGQVYILASRRLWGYCICLSMGIFTEILGYAGKLMLRQNPQDSNGYIMYIVCLTIAPSFISGVLYVSLSRFMWLLGRQYSRLHPSLIAWGFISADILSLSAIGAGGALGAIFYPSLLGIYIMIGGLAGQAICTLLFGLLALDYAVCRNRGLRGFRQTPSNICNALASPVKQFTVVISVASFCMLLRAGYRVAELSKGFDGPLMQEEITFFFLDSLPVALASACLTFSPPHLDIWYSRQELKRRQG